MGPFVLPGSTTEPWNAIKSGPQVVYHSKAQQSGAKVPLYMLSMFQPPANDPPLIGLLELPSTAKLAGFHTPPRVFFYHFIVG